MINKDYSQIIDFPTHVRGNTLDLLLTDLPAQGPIFYIVYNNDMDEAVVTLTTSKKLADYSKGAQAIRCAEDRDNLQGCIDNL